MAYKIIKADAEQLDFMDKIKACACMYCDYSEAFFCTFRGKKCPAGKEEYLKKINKHKNYEVQNYKNE